MDCKDEGNTPISISVHDRAGDGHKDLAQPHTVQTLCLKEVQDVAASHGEAGVVGGVEEPGYRTNAVLGVELVPHKNPK